MTGSHDEAALAEAAKPRALPLGELPGVKPNQLDSFGQTAAAFQVVDHLAVSDGLPSGSAQRGVKGDSPIFADTKIGTVPRFRPWLPTPNRPKSPRHERFRPGPIEHERPAILGRAFHLELPLQLADGLAHLLKNLDCPDKPAGVVRMQPGGGDGIDRGQTLVEPATAVAPGVVGQPAAQLPIGGRPLEDSPQQPL